MLAGGFAGPDDGPPPLPGGAVLAQLGTTTKSPGIQAQPPLDPAENWALGMVGDAARVMSGSTFEARHDPSKGGHGGHGCRPARSLSAVRAGKAGHRMTTAPTA